MRQNPILILDDDEDDLMIIAEVARIVGPDWPLKTFSRGTDLIAHLTGAAETPFLIISDVNLAGETGFEVKKRITDDPRLRYKGVPFIFWSTDASEKQIQQAYDLPAQGFFFKPSAFDELCDTLRLIIDYWEKCQHPKVLG